MTVADTERNRRWYGRDEPFVPAEEIVRGPLSVLVDGVDVRRVSYLGTPIMDRIFVAIRDPDWGTLPAIVDAPTRRWTDDSASGTTSLTFRARHLDSDIRFVWDGRITVGPGARVSMDMDGVAEGTFRYARMGLCALLPARSMAGRPFRASGVGPDIAGTLPQLIAPQLIVDGAEVPTIPAFRTLTVELPDVVVHQEFEGDDFEAEDQRNWTDDSFKAYSLMAGEPYPRTAQVGQRFHQRVTLTVVPREDVTQPVSGTGTGRRSGAMRDEVAISLTDAVLRWPAMGLGDTTDGQTLGQAEVAALAALRIDHMRLDVHPGRPGWQAQLRRGASDARTIGAGVELALSLDETAVGHLESLPDLLAGVRVARVLVLHAPTQATASTPAGWVARARGILGDSFPGARWIGGTDGDFAEINRDRPTPGGVDAMDGICYGLNPQIHASDEMSMAETLPAQGLTVATSAAWFPMGDLCVSPITLRQRFNPAATPNIGEPAPTDEHPSGLPAGVDARQRSLFGAAWTLGSIRALTVAGATSATWYQTVGWRGVLEWPRPPLRPAWGPLVAGEVYPLYHVFQDLADRASMVPSPCGVTADRDLVALAMRSPSVTRLLLANLTARPIHALIGGLPEGAGELRLLDETTPVGSTIGPLDGRVAQHIAIVAGTTAVQLRPFAYARLDVTA